MKLYLDLQHDHMTRIRHTANSTLVMDPAETNSGPIVQEWDLRLTQ